MSLKRTLKGLDKVLENCQCKCGFKTSGRSGVSEFLFDFDLYQTRSNKSNSSFDVSSDVVANLFSTLSKQKNQKDEKLTTFLAVDDSVSNSNQTVLVHHL